ncbi:hypothetical protein EON71_00860, partial [bacterium]
MTPNKVISLINETQTKRYIIKKTQHVIENWFTKHDENFNNNEKKMIKELISILKQGKINTESKNKLLNLKNALIDKIINIDKVHHDSN